MQLSYASLHSASFTTLRLGEERPEAYLTFARRRLALRGEQSTVKRAREFNLDTVPESVDGHDMTRLPCER